MMFIKHFSRDLCDLNHDMVISNRYWIEYFRNG